MHIHNLEDGVKNALLAHLTASGLSDAQAESKISSKLAAAVAYVHAEASKEPEEKGVPAAGSIHAVKAALASLKTWAEDHIS